MVGPFLQAIFLFGIIGWYSKNMMSMINDYYRSEFQRKLQANDPAAKPTTETTINVDNFMDYVREMDTKPPTEQQPVQSEEGECKIESELGKCYQMLRFMEITNAYPALNACSLPSRAADSSIS